MGNSYSYLYSVYINTSTSFYKSIPYDNGNIDQIYPRIYLSNLPTSLNRNLLKEFGITDIISIITGGISVYPEDFNYYQLDCIDTDRDYIKQYFEKTNQIIDDILSDPNKKVLIHCVCGVSRSATIAIAYLIKKHGLDPKTIIKQIKKHRKIINPNPGFIEQLEEYYKEKQFQVVELPLDFYPDLNSDDQKQSEHSH